MPSPWKLNETIPSGTIHHDVQANIIIGDGYNFETNSKHVYVEMNRGDEVVYIWLENEEVIDIAKELHERAITLKGREAAVAVVNELTSQTNSTLVFNDGATFEWNNQQWIRTITESA